MTAPAAAKVSRTSPWSGLAVLRTSPESPPEPANTADAPLAEQPRTAAEAVQPPAPSNSVVDPCEVKRLTVDDTLAAAAPVQTSTDPPKFGAAGLDAIFDLVEERLENTKRVVKHYLRADSWMARDIPPCEAWKTACKTFQIPGVNSVQ